MPKKAKELSAAEVRRITKPGFNAVGGVAGLGLWVKKGTGSRSWIMRVQIGTRRPDIGLGGYPDVSLEQARQRAREIRDQVYQGIDPLAARRAVQDALRAEQAKRLTFDQATAAFLKSKNHEWSDRHAKQWAAALKQYVSPVLGSMPVDQIELGHIIKVLNPPEESGREQICLTKTETATRVRGRMESVLAWAKVSGYRSGENPARWKGNLDQVLAKPSKIRRVEHLRAIPWTEMPAFMEELRQQEGMGARALEFAILTAARSGEVRLATWDEFDLGANVWTVPASRMKGGKQHSVPLSEPAVRLLEALPRHEGTPYVFWAPQGGPLSNMSLSAVTRRMEVDAVPHGFRSTFKDWCRSSTSYPDEVSELALAHVSTDATRAAYARDELLPKRTKLMRDWARFCGTPQRNGEVTPIRGAAIMRGSNKRESFTIDSLFAAIRGAKDAGDTRFQKELLALVPKMEGCNTRWHATGQRVQPDATLEEEVIPEHHWRRLEYDPSEKTATGEGLRYVAVYLFAGPPQQPPSLPKETDDTKPKPIPRSVPLMQDAYDQVKESTGRIPTKREVAIQSHFNEKTVRRNQHYLKTDW